MDIKIFTSDTRDTPMDRLLNNQRFSRMLGLAGSRTGFAFIYAFLQLFILSGFASGNTLVASFQAKSACLGVKI